MTTLRLVADEEELALRRPLALQDPDLIAAYERLVVAREGVARFREVLMQAERWLPPSRTEHGDWLRRVDAAESYVVAAQELFEDMGRR